MNGKEIKKKRISGGLFVLLAALTLTGCGANTGSAAVKETEQQETAADTAETAMEKQAADSQEETDTGYVFLYNGVTIGVDMDMEPIAEALGEPMSIFEQPSCAAQGTSYLYSYPGFDINTYPDGDTNYIEYILFRDDTVATPEGVDMSQTREEILAVYGDGYTENNNQITYEKGNMTLNFILEEDRIVSIEYDSHIIN